MKVKTIARPDGTVEVKVIDGAGPSCREAIAPYVEALPRGAAGRTTDDYHRVVAEEERQSEFA